MARNSTESEFRTSKMAAGSHFVKKIHKNTNCVIDLKWQEMRHSDFWTSKMATGGHFFKNIAKKVA